MGLLKQEEKLVLHQNQKQEIPYRSNENNNFDIEFNNKLNFTTLEFNYLLEYSGFTTTEKNVFKLRQNGRSNIDISVILNISLSSVNRAVRSVKGKIKRCIIQYYKMKQR